MGMDLLGNHGDERFHACGWRWCLERAIEFGWTPEGTVAPIDFPGECSAHCALHRTGAHSVQEPVPRLMNRAGDLSHKLATERLA
jgi:hypothetical protein